MHQTNAKPLAAVPEPRSRQLRLDLLHTFEAAARHLSFTNAGAELALSQPAVTRQIQQLEASLGAPLFERRHRSLVLTEAGRVMQRAVDDSLERLRDAAEFPAPAPAPPPPPAIFREAAVFAVPAPRLPCEGRAPPAEPALPYPAPRVGVVLPMLLLT